MGLSSSKQKSSSKSTAVSTPNVPSWISQPHQDFASQIGSLASNPTGGVAVGASGLQNQAFGNASGLGGFNAALGQAMGRTGGLMNFTPSNVTAGQLKDTDLSPYMNPYTNDVIDTSVRDMERARGGAIAQNQSAAMQAHSYGGSRHGIVDAETNRGFLDQVGSLVANLRNTGFQGAQVAALTDIGNRLTADTGNADRSLQGAGLNLNAASQLGTMGLAGDASRRADIGLQGDLGAQQREIDVESNPQEARMKELARIAALLGVLQGYPVGQTVNSTGTNTQTSNPSGASQIGTLVSGLGSLFSDRRLKRDAELIGEDARGLRWWRYRYVWDEPGVQRVGVMADEAPPHAVSQHESGYLMVDYGAL